MRIKFFTLVACLSALFSSVTLYAQTIREIEINPAQPHVGQAFTVKLKGDFPNSCYNLSYQGATLTQGNYINLYFTVTQSSGPCLAVIKPFTFTRTFQGLSYPGNYCIRAFGLIMDSEAEPCFNILPSSPYGTICDINIPTISCRDLVQGNNTNAPNRLTEYNCDYSSKDWYSGERVYRLYVDKFSEVNLELTTLDNYIDHNFFLLYDVCGQAGNPYYSVKKEDCIASGVISGNNYKVKKINTKLQEGSYLIVVDGVSGNDRGRFSLSVDCGIYDLCSKASQISCGDKLQNQTTIGGRNDVWFHNCDGASYEMQGNDRVYKITLDKPGKLFVEMNILTPGQDMQLFLAKGEACADPGRIVNRVETAFCLGKSPEFGNQSNRRTLLKDLPAGDYFVIVDTRMAMTQANFNISFNCNPVICGLNVTPSVLDVSSKGGDYTLKVNASRAWSSDPTLSWVTLTPRTGEDTADVKVNVLRKDDAGNRQTTLTFTCGTETQTVLLNQTGACTRPNTTFIMSRNGRTVILTAVPQDSAKYTWDFGNGITTSGRTDTVTLPNGVYRICLTVTSPCGTATSCQIVKVFGSLTEGELASLEQPKLTEPRLYPNPSRGETFLEYELPNAGQALIQVFDLSGREVSKALAIQADQGFNQTKLPLEQLTRGVYLVRVKLPNATYTQKLMLE